MAPPPPPPAPPPPPPPPPPPLMDELVEECLLRLPPDDPASLVGAALVCKCWHRIIADRGFGRRFRRLHRRPPMLGFFQQHTTKGLCFTSTSPFRPRDADLHLRFRGRRGEAHAIDSRHGRVLLSKRPFLSDPLHLFDLTVWDPITGDQLDLPELPPPQYPGRFGHNSRAVVLCASTACDHLDCHRGHFLVVLIDTSTHEVCTYVYSSEAGTWSHPSTVAQDLSDTSRVLHRQPVGMAGNALYFGVHRRITTEILRYDLGDHGVSWIKLPPDCRSRSYQILLMTIEYGGMGIARVENSRIHMWSRDADPNGVLGWTPSGKIELETVLPAHFGAISRVVFVLGTGAFFITTNAGAFTVDTVSNRVKKVFGNSRVSCFVPHTSFFTPALGAASTEEEPTAGVPSA